MGRKHCKIETAARMLGEPLERTQERVANWELPLVVRNGERLVPTEAVLKLRDRMVREGQTFSSSKPHVEAPNATRRQPAAGDEMSSGPKEFSARTVAEAVDKACSELGVSKDNLIYEIRDSGLLHILGLDSGLATIAVQVKPPGKTAPSPKGRADHEGSGGNYKASGSRHYYSAEQAARLFGTDAAGVEEMVRGGELIAEIMNGSPWFPSREFEDLVVSRLGSGHLTRVSAPYPAAEVRKAKGPPPRRSEPARDAEGAGSGRQSLEESSAVGGIDQRAIMEAAQRFGTSISDVRDKLSRGELVYQPAQRKLVEVSGSLRKATKAAEPTWPVGAHAGGSPEHGESELDEYVSVREVAHELGEPVNRVFSRIKKQGFAMQFKKDRRLYMLRRDALKLKGEIAERLAPGTQSATASPGEVGVSGRSPAAGSVSAEDRKEQEDSATLQGVPEKAGGSSAFSGTESRQGGEAGGLDRSSSYDLQPHSGGAGAEQELELRREIQRLRSQLEKEKRLRREKEGWIRALQGKLRENNAREESLDAVVEEIRRELAHEKEKVEALQKDKLLLDVVRRLAKGGSLPDRTSSGSVEPNKPTPLPEQAPDSGRLAEATAEGSTPGEERHSDEV